MKKALLITATSAMLFVAVVGVVHMPFARAFLARTGGCPFPSAAVKPTVERADALRVEAARRSRGVSNATSKPALGFTLGATRRDDVAAWARASGVTCVNDGIGLGIRCADVSLRALPAGGESDVRAEISFGFDLHEKLISAGFIARVGTPADARAVSEAAEEPLALEGPPTLTVGGTVLRPFEQHVDTWAYADYLGEVSTTHLGSGVVVTARHLAITD